MGDIRPSDCRFRLADEGRAYPRSACVSCGRTITTGLGRRCYLEVEPARPLLSQDEAAGEIDRLTEALADAAKSSLKLIARNAAAEEQNRLMREALIIMVDHDVDYITRNHLGDPEEQHRIKVARAALAKQEETKP